MPRSSPGTQGKCSGHRQPEWPGCEAQRDMRVDAAHDERAIEALSTLTLMTSMRDGQCRG